MQAEVAERIRQLSPAHQQDVSNIVMNKPTLKHSFQSSSGITGGDERATLLDAFEEYAGYTLPHLFPPEERTSVEQQVDYQSFGAQAVNNLAAKIVTTMFHPTRPFFKAKAPAEYIRESGRAESDIEADLSAVEREAMVKFAEKDGRTAMTDLALQLIVTGNAMLNKPTGKKYRVFSYRDFDATYDTFGDMSSAVVREWVSMQDLSPENAQLCAQYGKQPHEQVQVFTGIKRIKRVNDMNYYVVWQEIEHFCVLSKNYGVYSEDTLPWNPQRMYTGSNRHAGIGLVEMYIADIHMLSKIAQADQDLIAVLTDIKTLVVPGARTKVKELNDAIPGSYVAGHPDDLHSHTHDVSNQMGILDAKMDRVVRRLSQVFLLTSNAIRDAERVTAEEIRYIANELDQTHVGFYSRLARTLQRPLAKDFLREVSPLLKKFTPLIITGLESLSRMTELDNYRGFIADITNTGQALQGPHAAWINVEKLTKKFASGWGLDVTDVMYTPVEKQAEEQRQLELQAKVAQANQVPTGE